MRGIELSEAYYKTYGEPMLKAEFVFFAVLRRKPQEKTGIKIVVPRCFVVKPEVFAARAAYARGKARIKLRKFCLQHRFAVSFVIGF